MSEYYTYKKGRDVIRVYENGDKAVKSWHRWVWYCPYCGEENTSDYKDEMQTCICDAKVLLYD